jgi:aminocarboxymuconate-semialdehyde decarboxylase
VDNPHHPSKYLGKFYVDSLVHSPEALDYVIKTLGEDKVTLGSDYPFPLGEDEPGKLIKSMPYPFNIKEKLLHTNALNWLNLKKEQFALLPKWD